MNDSEVYGTIHTHKTTVDLPTVRWILFATVPYASVSIPLAYTLISQAEMAADGVSSPSGAAFATVSKYSVVGVIERVCTFLLAFIVFLNFNTSELWDITQHITRIFIAHVRRLSFFWTDTEVQLHTLVFHKDNKLQVTRWFSPVLANAFYCCIAHTCT